jgi:hypothetical protein
VTRATVAGAGRVAGRRGVGAQGSSFTILAHDFGCRHTVFSAGQVASDPKVFHQSNPLPRRAKDAPGFRPGEEFALRTFNYSV